MADRTQLKVADRNDIADDDPFAELTRIMGFDPRQPVKPQAPVQTAAPANQPAAEGDFDIDLEKELMGEFGAEESAAIAPPPEPAFEAAAPDALDDELAASLDQDFVFDDIEDHHFAAVPAVEAAAAPQVDAEPQFEAAFDEDFSQAVASSLDDVSPLEDDLPMDDELAASLDREFQLDDHAVEAVDLPAAEIAAPAGETAFEDDFDNAASLSLEDELTLDSHLAADDHVAPAVAKHPAPVQAVADHAVPEQDFAGHFDETLADVEMDFDVQAEEPVEIEAPSAVEAPAEPARAAEMDVPELAVQEAFDDDFELGADDALAEEPVTVEAPAEAAYVADTNEDAPELLAQEAFDDHFELDIDDLPAEEVEQPAAEIAAAAVAPVAPVVAAVAPIAPVVATVEPPKPVAAADERSLEDELNALLGAMSRPIPVAREPEPIRQPVVEKPTVQQAAADLDWNLDEQQAAPAEAAAPDIDFDDDAFDAAFARGIEGDREPGHAVAPASGSQDWLRSTPPEPERSWSRVTPVAAPAQASFTAQPMASVAPVSTAPSYRQEPVVEDVPIYAEPEPAQPDHQQAYDEMPDVETVDVPERVVALADDLDIPELDFEEEKLAAPAYDDLDAEFAGLLNEMNAVEVAPTPAPARAAYEDDSYSAGFKPGYDHGEARAYAAAKPAEMSAAPAPASQAAATSGFDMDDLPGSRPVSQADEFAVDELDYDPELDQEMAVPGLAEREAARPRGRGLLVAAVVGAVALAGGIGAFALSFGGKGVSEAPVIVKADNTPIKVKPENPGGTVVPNQDSKVYDAVVKGTKPAEPVQEKLVTNSEEPVDVKAKEPESRVVDLSPADTNAASGTDAGGNAAATVMPGVDVPGNTDAAPAPAPKSEDRIAQVLQEADKGTNPEVVAVAPRKVRTMMVKPDGSLVAREDPAPEAAPQVAAAEPADPAPQHVAPAAQAGAEQTGTVAPATDQASDLPTDQVASADQTEAAEPLKPAEAPKAEAKAEAKTQTTHTQSANTPATVPVAPQRPSDQPVDVVGEVKPDQVASISPSAAAAGGGSWSMQIASQPTVESAQSTYQDLQRRYGSVLSGRTANIVKAEIAGKGTFYRVRVPAQSRNDAINLCTSYKAAGGNCFVSR
ncbi:SPOR domain-containing protein [Mesorhizobium sp. 131-2-1]|uniref:SPOR domain-containing protein n=1 Tax=Mesorhizobium sp. 131-2-1 TaxID=2744518 RepID=UPI00192633BE|nr:SPOR domain-containing protein [Mesorhizobium sp. 131-2-1]BCG94206.1 sporulation protein [Mesorhizobium sp. 131-2-1]